MRVGVAQGGDPLRRLVHEDARVVHGTGDEQRRTHGRVGQVEVGGVGLHVGALLGDARIAPLLPLVDGERDLGVEH